MTTKLSTEEIVRSIKDYKAHTTGTSVYHRWSPLYRKIVITDGAKFVADTASAYWLLDAIGSHQIHQKVRENEFQIWTLSAVFSKANGHHSELSVMQRVSAKYALTCEDGNGNTITVQEFGYTDFPEALMPFELWLERSGDLQVIYLPEER